jgi:hypothetical protein
MTHPKYFAQQMVFVSEFRAIWGAFCDQNYMIVGVYSLISLRTAFFSIFERKWHQT